jgi:hypothetical protein
MRKKETSARKHCSLQDVTQFCMDERREIDNTQISQIVLTLPLEALLTAASRTCPLGYRDASDDRSSQVTVAEPVRHIVHKHTRVQDRKSHLQKKFNRAVLEFRV